MASSPADLESKDGSTANAVGAGLIRKAFVPQVVKIADTINHYKPVRFFQREYHHVPTTILSLDFDDKGELLMTSESDDTLQIYSVTEGVHKKTVPSKKYGAKLARFTHSSTAVLYASTLENNDIRYLSTHDNSFIKYFRGHTSSVTSMTMHPTTDTFLSTSLDNTLRVWDLKAGDKAIGFLDFFAPTLCAFDPSATVMAVASAEAQTVLLYDYRKYQSPPFASFDILDVINTVSPGGGAKHFTKLEFSNDGKSLLVGTNEGGHLILDAFDGTLTRVLQKHGSTPTRYAPGEKPASESPPKPDKNGKIEPGTKFESSGDCCFSPDGRYVFSAGGKAGIAVYDLIDGKKAEEEMVMKPTYVLEESSVSRAADGSGLLAWNPRWSMFATAGKGVQFWVPEREDK